MLESSPPPEPQPFQSSPECLICQFYSCDLHLRCAVRPYGVEVGEVCPDFMPFKGTATPEVTPYFKK